MLRAIFDIILPPTCHLCGTSLTESEEFVCKSCLNELPRTGYHKLEDNPVELRLAGRFPFERASSHFFYSPNTQFATLIHDFKYRGFPSIARSLGRLMARELWWSGWLNDIDFVCPVPLHWSKYLRRGYNQSEEIARGISEEAGIDLSLELRAKRSHRTQTSFSHIERQSNVKDIFTLRHAERYAGKTILIIDDVCTTGATLTSAAETILAAQPTARLVLLTLAATF